jgi:hypothetical protein
VSRDRIDMDVLAHPDDDSLVLGVKLSKYAAVGV